MRRISCLAFLAITCVGCATASAPPGPVQVGRRVLPLCPAIDEPAQPILFIRPTTRISIETVLDPALSRLLEHEYALTQPSNYARRSRRPILSWLAERQLGDGRFANPNEIRVSPDNILITQTIGLKPDGEPYLVRLSAQQGRSLWSRSIERSGLMINHSGAGVGPEMRLPDGRIYYDPAVDIQRLTTCLISALRVEGNSLD